MRHNALVFIRRAAIRDLNSLWQRDELMEAVCPAARTHLGLAFANSRYDIVQIGTRGISALQSRSENSDMRTRSEREASTTDTVSEPHVPSQNHLLHGFDLQLLRQLKQLPFLIKTERFYFYLWGINELSWVIVIPTQMTLNDMKGCFRISTWMETT